MLSALCLSLVPVLRCVALKRIERSTLLIPPGIELLFSIALFFKRDDTKGRYHYLLCAEGVVYFLLALMDFLTNTVHILRQDLLVFKIVDTILGGLALVPLLFFTVWFLFTAQQELVHLIPARLQIPTKCISMGCTLLITASNAIGAFIGVSYRSAGVVITIGFIDKRARLLWTFFNMFSLALLAVFEVMAFFLLFARLMKVILRKRRRELMGGTGEIHHFRGIIHINLGMLLSLVETLIGFANQSFTVEITRRGTKTAGRILIILGLLRGWDYLEDVRFALQQPPKSRRISRFSIRQLFPNIRSPDDEAQVSERSHARVSVRYPRGRAPTLHLRLSEFDVTPVLRALRSPTRSQYSLRTHLIPDPTPTGSPVETLSQGHLDVPHSPHRNPPSDVPTSPTTPNSFWTITQPTSRVNSSTVRAGSPQLSTHVQDASLHHPTHTRDNTMSSTMSNLQAEVVTLSGSPPDPGFVLPIPSRSWSRQNLYMPAADSTQTAELEYIEDTRVDYGPNQPAHAISRRHITPVNEHAVNLSPLAPPQSRQPSWISESSDLSSAVISTARRLTRANTGVSMTPGAARRTPTVISDDVLTRQQSMVISEHLPGSPLSAVCFERPGGNIG